MNAKLPRRILMVVAGTAVFCLLALAACDGASQTPASPVLPGAPSATTTIPVLPASPLPTGQPEVAAATRTPTPQATPTPAACTSITASESLRLSDVPGAVRNPIAMAQIGSRIFVAGRVSANYGIVEGDALKQIVPTDGMPADMLADTASGRLYILNQEARTIGIYDAGQLRATLPISSTRLQSYQQLSAIALDAAHNRLFAIANSESSEVFVVDTQAFTVTERIFLPDWRTSVRLAIDPTGARLFIGSYDRVDVLDLASRLIVQTIPLPFHSYYFLAVDRATGRLFVDQYDEGPFVGVIQDGKVIAQVPVGADPNDAVVLGNRLYVSNGYSNTVSVVDLAALTTVATIEVGLGPRAVLADSDGSRIYVAIEGSYGSAVNRLEVIDTTTLSAIRRIPLMAQPSQMIADATRGRLYALMSSQGTLVISDGRRVLQSVLLERAPMQMALDERTGRLYVTDWLASRVSVIDGTTGLVIERRALSLPSRPEAVAVDALNQRLIVNNRVFMLDSLAASGYFTLTGFTVPYGDGQTPQRLIANPQLPRLYVVASNGVPGSNSGLIPYLVDSVGLKQIGVGTDRSVSAFVLDASAQKLYIASTHPMGGNTTLNVSDAMNLTRINALPVQMHISALALNPHTSHLFATLRSLRYGAQTSVPDDFRLDVLDTRTLGRVASFRIGADPIAAAVLGDRIYIAHATGDALTVVQDCVLAMAAAPTPTPTPSPYPTIPRQPSPTATPTRTPTPTPTRAPALPSSTPPVPCRIPLATWLQTAYYATFDFRANVGCPLDAPRAVRLAKQYFQNGMMYWREDTRKIYVIFNNGSWSVYDDLWDESQPEGGTERPPTPDLFAPKRGFGKVWRDALGGPNSDLGWALTGERGVAGEAQAFDRGHAFRDDVGATYVLAPSGSWR